MNEWNASRRGFLAGTAALLMAGEAGAKHARRGAEDRIGFTTVSIRDRLPFRFPGAPAPAAGTLDMLRAPAFAVETLGLRRVELWNLQFDENSDEYCARIRDAAKAAGVTITNIQVDGRLDMGSPDPDERARAIADSRAWIDRAAVIGAPSVRINASSLAPKGPFDLDATASSFADVADYAASRKIRLLTENHIGHSVVIANLVALLEKVDHPAFRTVFDWGNVPEASTDTVIAAAQRLSPWLAFVSAKGVVFDGDYRPTNYDATRIVEATEKLGYRGDYSIELFGPTPAGFDPLRAIASMRKYIEAGLG